MGISFPLIFHTNCVVQFNWLLCCDVVSRHSACFGGLAGANVPTYHVGEETDGQVRRGKPCVLSLSSTKYAADVCDILRDRDK